MSILPWVCRSCQKEDGTDDMKKGTQLLEVYALEIQIHTELKNNKDLKELYYKALQVKSAIPHPRIMGVIRECGGKMHMMERVWVEAATDFFEVQMHANALDSLAFSLLLTHDRSSVHTAFSDMHRIILQVCLGHILAGIHELLLLFFSLHI